MQYTLIHVHPQKYWMDTTLVSSYDCVFSSFGLMVYYLCFRNLMKLLILQGFKKWAPINILKKTKITWNGFNKPIISNRSL
jgi:hypothetical protein